MAELHLVANRLPVTFDEKAGWTRSPGGLVTALDSVVRRRTMSWWGSGATVHDGDGPLPSMPASIQAIDVDRQLAAEAIDGFANATLWPALHGETERVRWRHSWVRAYQRFNALFARRLAATCGRGGLIWVHDFHLLFLPLLLKRHRPDLSVGLSLHTPFDTATVTRLPIADELAAAIGAADLVGVQTERDRRQVDRLVDGSGRPSASFVSPVSVDPDELSRLSGERAFQAMRDRHLRRAGGRLLAVGVDRLDYTKGVLERFEAIDLAFQRGTLRPDDVHVVQIAQPTRSRVSAYVDLRVRAERIAHQVASRWTREDGSPAMTAVFESWDRREVLALLSVADLALVTPRRDGMNLVAKEFSTVNDRGGVLVIGRGAGASDALGVGAVLVDGADPESVAGGIERALALSPAQRSAMSDVRARTVARWTSGDWAADYVSRLGDVAAHRAADRPVIDGDRRPCGSCRPRPQP